MIAEVAVPAPGRLDRVVERLLPLHARLCPRQILGARIGLRAGDLFGLELPQLDKRLLAIVESDGCFLDGVAQATGCRVGRRTMRIMDHGKVAATFVDTLTGEALRVRPHLRVRERARAWAPRELDGWQAMLKGYRELPDAEILEARSVVLAVSLSDLIGRPGLRVPCTECGEEIMNAREIRAGGGCLCRSCAGQRYVVAHGEPAPSGTLAISTRQATPCGRAS